MDEFTYKCKENDAVIKFLNESEGSPVIDEVWIRIEGEDSDIIVGYKDLQTAIRRAKKEFKSLNIEKP